MPSGTCKGRERLSVGFGCDRSLVFRKKLDRKRRTAKGRREIARGGGRRSDTYKTDVYALVSASWGGLYLFSVSRVCVRLNDRLRRCHVRKRRRKSIEQMRRRRRSFSVVWHVGSVPCTGIRPRRIPSGGGGDRRSLLSKRLWHDAIFVSLFLFFYAHLDLILFFRSPATLGDARKNDAN